MALKKCAECGKDVSTFAGACPHCGAPVGGVAAKPGATAKEAGERAKTGCTGCGAALALLFLWILFASYCGDKKPRAKPKPRTPPASAPAPEVPPAPPPAKAKLDLAVSACNTESGYTVTIGSVKNTGDVVLHFVQLDTSWEDADGVLVDAGTTYAVGSEYLRPGESATFRASTRHGRAQRCLAKVRSHRVVR